MYEKLQRYPLYYCDFSVSFCLVRKFCKILQCPPSPRTSSSMPLHCIGSQLRQITLVLPAIKQPTGFTTSSTQYKLH